MIVALVTELSILAFAAGETRAICPNETIKAVEGDNVILPCHLDPPVNVVEYTVDWKRVDLNKVVYSYRHKKENCDDQMDQYRNRTTLNHEDLSRGVLTLQISSVKLSDSGQYRCYVPKLKASCIDLIVVTKDQQNETKRDDSSTTGPPEEEVTEPDDPDAAKKEAVIVSVGGVVGVVAVAAAVVLILVKCGTIQICMRGQEAETMGNYNSEMENLKNQAAEHQGDEDPHSAAENGLRELVVWDDNHSSPQR